MRLSAVELLLLKAVSWAVSESRNRRSSGVCYVVGPRAVFQRAELGSGGVGGEEEENKEQKKS